MRFPVTFTRTVGGAGPALGSDAPPTSREDLVRDVVVTSPPLDPTGNPIERVAIAIAGPDGDTWIPCAVYLHEETIGWVQLDVPIMCRVNAVSHVRIPALATRQRPGTPANAVPVELGGLEVAAVPQAAPGAPDGVYRFAIGLVVR